MSTTKSDAAEMPLLQRIVFPGRTVIFGVLAALIMLVGGGIFEEFGVAKKAREWSEHTYKVRGTLYSMSLAINQAESNQRAYLLLGSEDSVARYEAAVARVRLLNDYVRQLTSDNPSEQERLRDLVPAMRRELDELALSIRLRRTVGLEAALGAMSTGAENDPMETIGATIAAMMAEEQGLLATRLAEADARISNVRILALGGTALIVMTLFGTGWMLDRSSKTDALTGLLSRNRMWELLTKHIGGPTPRMAAMLCVDLDRFRSVNQVFGAHIGDMLLIEVGRRLKQVSAGYSLGRLGSNDFAIYCVGITPSAALDLGVSTAAVLAQPFDVQGHVFHLTASVGVAHTDTTSEVDLRQSADDAMHTAKREGGNRVVVYARSMHDGRKDLAELEEDLRLAIDRDDELTMVYQPVVRLTDRKLFALEALARWTHPRLGAISPDRFVELAETRDLMIPLGLKLMGMTIRQAALWHASFPGRCPVININISPTQFAAGDVIADLVLLLGKHGLRNSDFCIEVTEGTFANADAIRALENARQIGFKVSMDDFGVGYSSLSQLLRLPLASIKLDRSFIVQSGSTHGAAVLAAVVQLAHALKLAVVAEGVEHEEELALVTECGCEAVQGYVFSRPLRPEALNVWLSGASFPAVEFVGGQA